ncbi:MAG TPA: hypothetical protein VFD58_12880 [Blastocatellia bacterium]|nr:hypothetical protein [Blastocatellia bacterium]
MTNPAVIFLALAESILSIDGSFLFVFILVICLVFILNATLFKPINRILEERERLSTGRLSEAQKMIAEYSERLRRYEEQIRSARAEAYQTLEAQRKDALKVQQELMAQTRAETADQIAAAKQEISSQTEAARARLEQDARAMAATISSSILQRPITTPEGISAS